MPLFGPSYFESAKTRKQTECKNALEKASELLANLPVCAQDDAILAAPAWQIAEKIRSKEWSTLTVVTAFARRCIAAHNDLNCLTESDIVMNPANRSHDL